MNYLTDLPSTFKKSNGKYKAYVRHYNREGQLEGGLGPQSPPEQLSAIDAPAIHNNYAASDVSHASSSDARSKGTAHNNNKQILDPHFDENTIRKDFALHWVKEGIGKPTIEDVIDIRSPVLHDAYHSTRSNMTDKSERWGYHGVPWSCSKLACDDCVACSIREVGFLISKSGSSHSFTRFGPGLYFASESCKSHGYTKPNAKELRCILLCKIIVGRSKQYSKNQTTLKGVPKGFDSIHGVADDDDDDDGGDLNYDEYVVFNNSQVIPVAAILYKCKDNFPQFESKFALDDKDGAKGRGRGVGVVVPELSGSSTQTASTRALPSVPALPTSTLQYKALFDYNRTSDSDLTFCAGDMITIHKMDASGWWHGELNGRSGLVPSNYLDIVDAQTS